LGVNQWKPLYFDGAFLATKMHFASNGVSGEELKKLKAFTP
jgi:hypothetical protein